MADEVKDKLKIIWKDEDGTFINGMSIEDLWDENQRLRSLFEEIANLYERHSADDGVAKMILARAKAALDGEKKD